MLRLFVTWVLRYEVHT